MQWWQKRQARKNMPKEVARILKEIDRQFGPAPYGDVEPTVFEKLVTTLDDINGGKASREQKIAISIRLVELAEISDTDKAALAGQIEQVYGISATE